MQKATDNIFYFFRLGFYFTLKGPLKAAFLRFCKIRSNNSKNQKKIRRCFLFSQQNQILNFEKIKEINSFISVCIHRQGCQTLNIFYLQGCQTCLLCKLTILWLVGLKTCQSFQFASLSSVYFYKGSGCGTVDSVVASDTRRPGFESSHRKLQLNNYLLFVQKTKIKKKMPIKNFLLFLFAGLP